MDFRGKTLFNASFDVYANNYDEVRPSYPDELFDDIYKVCDITDTNRILEIGAGSGISTKKLGNFNCRIVAVEPGESLCKIARASVANNNKIQVINSTFEDFSTTEKFEAIATFTALHWLKNEDVYPKLLNLLAEDGKLITVWNSFLKAENTTTKEIEDLYQKWLPDIYAPKTTKEVNEGVLNKLNGRIAQIAHNPYFNLIFLNRYLTHYNYDEKTYPQLLKTFPKIIDIGDDDKREGFLDEVSKVIAKHKVITVPVLSTLLVSQKKVDFLNQLVREEKEKC